ncbi:hypothetical protein [Psychrobacter raelei]|uniref:hypothetical protein n=1 Tax=Psychrobacter raelei TaxID=2565531 RepID=UPI003F5FD1D8
MSKSNKDASKPQKKWYFATNHQNVLMYLAMNTITSTFVSDKNKYYQDSLMKYSGWIPLFLPKLPESIVDQNQLSDEGSKVKLQPVLLEINLNNYNDSLTVYSGAQESWINISASQLNDEKFITDDNIDTSVVLIPSQLATGYITSIKVQTAEIKKKIEDKAKDTNNIDIGNYKISLNKKLFEGRSVAKLLPSDNVAPPSAENFNVNYRYVNAISGVYAVLSLLANVNDQALNALSSLLKKPLPTPSTNSDKNDAASHPKHLHEIIDNFCRWVLNPCTEISDPASKVFIDTVKIIINSTNTVKSKEKILELLNAQARDEQSQQFVADLSGKLGLSSKPFDELMETYSTRQLNRVLLMFFYAEDIERFLNLDKSKSKLNEVEVVLAATLLALDTGWLKLPSDFKTYATIEKPISFVMTKLGQIHKGIDTSNPDDLNSSLETPVVYFDDIDFPMPIRYLLIDKWNKPQQEAAKVLIKEQKWDCIDYEVVFPQGSYEFDTTKTYLKIKSKSEIKVREIVDQSKFLHLMSQLNYIDAATEKSMRGKL